ncbi:MAG: ABC-type uncharacterized transport system involved in gliding motility auxiliary subunit [Hyphomicrobiaceae bacterium]|jgi:ABC-type uncharacterized transport system involved in gliding motility auxiliary subunit
MNTRAPILGIAGLTFVIFAALEHWMTFIPGGPFFVFAQDWFAAIHVVVGLVCLVAWLASDSGSVLTFMRRRSTRYGASAIVYTALFVALVAMLNFVGFRYNQRLDLSSADVNSLSEQSLKVLASLEEDVEVLAFTGPADRAFVQHIKTIYEHESPRITFRIIDPQINPELAQQELISNIPTLKIKIADRATTVGKLDEEAITNGINSVSATERKKIYVVEGHGEASLADKKEPAGIGLFADALTNQNYLVEPIFLADEENVPDDASALIVPSSPKPWFPTELEALDRYLRRGGRAMFLLEPGRNPELDTFMTKWGVRTGQDVVVEERMRLFQGVSLGLEPVVGNFTEHPAVAAMAGQRTMFSVARTVNVIQDAPEGILVEPIAFTSENSWAETDIKRVFESGEAKLDEGADDPGPVPVILAGRGRTEDIGGEAGGEFLFLVFGDTSFVTNQYLQQVFNDALATGAVSYLAGEDELVSIGPRAIRASRAHLSDRQALTVFYLSVLVLPELILLLGIAVWWRRSSL